MVTNDIVSEKFLVFLASCVSCAVSLVILSRIVGGWLVLGNSQIIGSMNAVLVSFILNLIIYGVSKVLSTLSFAKVIRTQVIVNIFVVFITVRLITTFVPLLGFETIHFGTGLIVAMAVVACQYITYLVALKILSKDF